MVLVVNRAFFVSNEYSAFGHAAQEKRFCNAVFLFDADVRKQITVDQNFGPLYLIVDGLAGCSALSDGFKRVALALDFKLVFQVEHDVVLDFGLRRKSVGNALGIDEPQSAQKQNQFERLVVRRHCNAKQPFLGSIHSTAPPEARARGKDFSLHQTGFLLARNENAVGRQILENHECFFSSVYDEIPAGILHVFAHVLQFLDVAALKIAKAGFEHYGQFAHVHVFGPFLDALDDLRHFQKQGGGIVQIAQPRFKRVQRPPRPVAFHNHGLFRADFPQLYAQTFHLGFYNRLGVDYILHRALDKVVERRYMLVDDAVFLQKGA